MNIIENNKIQMKKTNEMILNGLKLIYEINGMIFQKRKEMKKADYESGKFHYKMCHETKEINALIKRTIKETFFSDSTKTHWSQRMKKWQCGKSWTFYDTREGAIEAFNVKHADAIKKCDDEKCRIFEKYNVTPEDIAKITATLPQKYRN